MTLAPDRRRVPPPRPPAEQRQDPDQPVEFWPTSAIRSALQSGDIDTWKRIAAALKRDPYGRTARQVEEVLDGTRPYGIAKALWEVLERARAHLEANERAEVARHVRLLIDRSGLGEQEFASRIGVAPEELVAYLDGSRSPSASLMIRIRRLSDRFVKVKSPRSAEAN
ncbi:XRE family transcriptional regulator [Mycobacterium sp. 663a-19]|uniref:XRE family transcriptional regulator n=1 Tax=Mycobacterium sp. 663a-19 TaxID=2986148 RepID=UPI002D1E58E7|nr:XRE family transcriptional regulator [Mycobacterium sp. 663a-19]MEB3980548.1 XRE family transcriptional regulator [Mycobacterium sp. 663a-19]